MAHCEGGEWKHDNGDPMTCCVCGKPKVVGFCGRVWPMCLACFDALALFRDAHPEITDGVALFHAFAREEIDRLAASLVSPPTEVETSSP